MKGNTQENKEKLKLIKALIENVILENEIEKNKSKVIEKILKNEISISEIDEKIHNLEIDLYAKRFTILVKTRKEEKKEALITLEKSLDKKKYFLLDLKKDKILILVTFQKNEKENIREIVSYIEKKLKTKLQNLRIGIGNIKKNIKNINESLLEAQIAMEIGEIFEKENKTIYYNNLGINRIIYKLPNFICEEFIKETLNEDKIKKLNKEMLVTINEFFENNLNISETSKKLFVHRNTLIYRLEKIKNLTGLDLKTFKDAMKFKLALTIQKYLNYSKNHDDI